MAESHFFYGCIDMFIHWSVDERPDFFHNMAIINSAAMNIVMHVSFLVIVLSGYMPDKMDHMATLF